MNTEILIASSPPGNVVFIALLVLFGCPLLALTFFIASVVLFAQKERKTAKICALLGLLFTLVPLLSWLLVDGLQ